MGRNQQKSFFTNDGQHRHCHGGSLRQQRRGRGQRPLSSKLALHVVFKINRDRMKHGGLRTGANFIRVSEIIGRYAKRFFVKVEQMSIQGDHVHLLLRTVRRSQFHYFFRVVAGQIAQQFQDEGRLHTTCKNKKGSGLWKHRPFSRVVAAGRKSYETIRNYIQLNEQEARGHIRYQKNRLKGLSPDEWNSLWV